MGDKKQSTIDSSSFHKENEKLRLRLQETSKELKRANRRLRDLDKQKEEFISMAAHELRAPVTAIKGYISMILEGDAGDIPDKARNFLADASAINERVIRLVNNMLNVSRIEEGRMVYQMGIISLSKVAKIVYDQFKVEAERKGLRFSVGIPKDIYDVCYVDKDKIYEVAANYVSNAVKYTDEGSITIRLEQVSRDSIRFTVEDTGPGITPEEQERLFRKFYRVESTVGKTIGTGLGLYISKLIVEKFNGRVGLKSVYGKGSTFWFELPIKKVK